MLIIIGSCQHPALAIHWDTDEWKCRNCGWSLSFPPRPPGADEKRPLPGGAYRGPRDEVGVTEAEEEKDEAPDEAPDADDKCLLRCSCCRQSLPVSSFGRRNNPAAKNREYRQSRCRVCTAFQLRARRQQDPERFKTRDRERRERWLLSLPPDLQAAQRNHGRNDTEANNAASKRYKARQAGVPVLLQRRGRPPIHLAPVCRVSASCPLAGFCVDKVATAKAVLSRTEGP